MNSIISFKEVDIGADGTIRCSVIRDGDTSEFYIKLPYSFQPRADLVATAFVLIAGRAYEHIHIDLAIGPQLHSELQKWSNSQIVARKGIDTRRSPGREKVLNFSGGFDSMAALALEPNAHLVSLDFGGRFSRERQFFAKFQPNIIETNLVDLKLNRYSWTFMGIGALLFRDELNISSYAFGSIMAGSATQLVNHPIDQQKQGLPPAQYFKMECANPVSGLSEIASMKIAALYRPDLLLEILKSVALPEEGKFLRKYQMLEAVLADLGMDYPLPSNLPNRPRGIEWGESLATDLSALYVMTVLGIEHVLQVYPQGIPDEILNFASTSQMEFMNHINPHAYQGVSYKQLSSWYYKMIRYGITPFNREHWHQMTETVELLSYSYHD